MKERRDSGLEGFRRRRERGNEGSGGMRIRRDAGQEEYRESGMQVRRDAGKEGRPITRTMAQFISGTALWVSVEG